MHSTYFMLFLLLLSSCKLAEKTTATEQSRWEQHVANTEIIRDDFGVPHIYGTTDADAVFGLLYAQCEEDFARVERNYIWAIGRLAEVEGEEALYSDLRARLFMTRAEAIEAYQNSPPWLQKLCDAFADGINYYLHTHPEVKPQLLTRFEPWMPMYFSEGSIGGDIENISVRRIRDFYADRADAQTGSLHPGLIRPDDREPRGSNGIAIAGSRTASGHAMLLINPHTSFYFRGEVHVVSEEGLNAYGAVTWGQFFVYQGFNEKTGWMHTSTDVDFMDDFIEEVRETSDGYVYTYGSEERVVEQIPVTLQFRAGDELRKKTFDMYRTHHGPVTQAIDGKWVATAMMWDPVQALIQSFTRTKLSSHEAFREMMNLRTNSSNNTVYADADGNIAYYHGNFIPKRDTRFAYQKPVDGTDPATDWQGLHPVDELITVVNPPNGWIQNCNSTPFTSAGVYSPRVADYPYYVSRNEENFRGVHAIRLLEKANQLTLDGLIELAHDPYLPAFEVLIPGLLEAYAQTTPIDASLAGPINVLRQWDYAVSTASVAMSLAHFYGMHCLREGSAPDGLSLMERIQYYGTEALPEERLALFRATVDQLNQDFGSWQTPWGDINRYQRLSGDIQPNFDDDLPSMPIGMASGRWGALASYGARAYDTKRLYGTSGNSFVAAVEFGDKVKAKSILAGGQSGDPDSPHFMDQIQRYADAQFKEVAYYREDVEARAKRRYRPGETTREGNRK